MAGIAYSGRCVDAGAVDSLLSRNHAEARQTEELLIRRDLAHTLASILGKIPETTDSSQQAPGKPPAGRRP
ncbi:hypothetical protein MJA45_26625 [Paenibacillus aurantius]|uniref:Uncharacterized protein n=1 Tax=Paenibacillus aurantius TaxID=2918900 RepID=A0AA96LGL9_9BACL|nr:hypothetical protein [Paenibacillus aurantius]WNQ11132.1 hypothetical protein MJA45_26625 [Paenibacillus aurantius]